MKALVFAAGLGERMRPLTLTTPKPLLVAGGKPLIVWHIEKLAAIGVNEVVVNTSWLAPAFAEALGDGSRWGLRLRYLHEGDTPLETGGGMWNALDALSPDGAPFVAVKRRHLDRLRLRAAAAGATRPSRISCRYDNPGHNNRRRFRAGRRPRAQRRCIAPHVSGIGVYRPALFDGWRSIVGDVRESTGRRRASSSRRCCVPRCAPMPSAANTTAVAGRMSVRPSDCNGSTVRSAAAQPDRPAAGTAALRSLRRPRQARREALDGRRQAAATAWGAAVPQCRVASVPHCLSAALPQCLSASVPRCLGASAPQCAVPRWRARRPCRASVGPRASAAVIEVAR